jgi:hypothetical protein
MVNLLVQCDMHHFTHAYTPIMPVHNMTFVLDVVVPCPLSLFLFHPATSLAEPVTSYCIDSTRVLIIVSNCL